jgi:hypothetical protein
VILPDEIVGMFIHPPILLPFAKKVTFPGADTVATKFVTARKTREEGTARDVVVSEMATLIKVIATLPGET